jgi:hypothetical protein
VVYIASCSELPESKWKEDAPAFYLEAVSANEKVRARFSAPHVYYAGSHIGCGCGFRKDGETGAGLELCQANYESLVQSVLPSLSGGARVEIFCCWAGDEMSQVASLCSLGVSDLLEPSFQFSEGQFLYVALDA